MKMLANRYVMRENVTVFVNSDFSRVVCFEYKRRSQKYHVAMHVWQ